MVISKPDATGTPNRIIINNWSSGDLSINLTGSAVAAPQITLSGDIKKAIDDRGTPDTSDDVFKITDGNYERDTISGDGNQEGALDLFNGTAGNDVIDGKAGSDYLNGKAGDSQTIHILNGFEMAKTNQQGLLSTQGFAQYNRASKLQLNNSLCVANTNEWRVVS